jgi:hypothetical protein
MQKCPPIRTFLSVLLSFPRPRIPAAMGILDATIREFLTFPISLLSRTYPQLRAIHRQESRGARGAVPHHIRRVCRNLHVQYGGFPFDVGENRHPITCGNRRVR